MNGFLFRLLLLAGLAEAGAAFQIPVAHRSSHLKTSATLKTECCSTGVTTFRDRFDPNVVKSLQDPDDTVNMWVLKREGVDCNHLEQLRDLVQALTPFKTEVVAPNPDSSDRETTSRMLSNVLYKTLPITERSISALDWLKADVLSVTREYGRVVADAPLLRVKLQVVDKVLCGKFHTDNVRARLLCTYVGPGTEWLEECDVDRRALMASAENDRICRGNKAKQAMNSEILLLRGGKASRYSTGVVHKSPSPDAQGQHRRRLILTIDEAEPE